MDRDQVIATLRAHEAPLRRRGVAYAALFGSLARNVSKPTAKHFMRSRVASKSSPQPPAADAELAGG